MGRIFISAGHGAGEPGGQAGGTTEAQEMILLRDQIVPELRSRGFEVLSVPDDQTSTQSISWINARSRSGDVALEIHADAYSNPATRGATVFYISSNEERKQNAELLLLALLRRVPQLPSRGVKPDTATGVGRLSFCRDTFIPSLLMEVGYLTNPDDRFLIQNRRRDIALGIADGLASWSRGGTPTPDPGTSPTYPSINININNQVYGEKGVLINSNAYIPIDLVDRLAIDLTNNTSVRRVSYRGVVYVKAIELRPFNISVGWDSATRTLSLRSILPICPGQLDRIMGYGNTSEVQMIMFLKANNENALAQFPDLPKLYREEATIEGVNYDIAFCQMCVETGFLRFGGDIKPSQNNFAALGSIGGASESATFPSARIGVRAHIQHLKAYASLEPLVQELVDPRFRFVTRGVAPLISQLSGRWAADPQYGTKIEATLRRLYESAGFL
ncbi:MULTISPECIES: N-acetylmuramoyl-L-alanine amidase [unclassified Coleofasciculus]|uniref:hormogonium tapered terminus morphoprotein TftA n=1 Tax=Cyanophyceae TaxID=3028117 RepID=UPI001688F4C7|nr:MULTISPECIES: N-acetylmuramoyl-L-alanine amidase [unclassified Coleofasciculus]MBD1896511.1 N-acetylmuramoyl-L-alanine amidase [Coleofasciculus sp. FACHB-129]MBD2084646.1 N-acetylmuramoyl-L-alanine amidase [Coleofasciculus sp. FACHB-542]